MNLIKEYQGDVACTGMIEFEAKDTPAAAHEQKDCLAERGDSWLPNSEAMRSLDKARRIEMVTILSEYLEVMGDVPART